MEGVRKEGRKEGRERVTDREGIFKRLIVEEMDYCDNDSILFASPPV